MAEREALTADYVRSILHYAPETGVFTWRERPCEHFATLNACGVWNSRCAGKTAGNIDRGYVQITIDGRPYRAHRLAWLYMTGEWPINDIDHASLDRSDNRFANLREATRSQNGANRRAMSNNTSGVKGVSWHASTRKWQARIQVAGKSKPLGYFDDLEAAAAAYERAAHETFGEFARTA